MPRLRFRLGLGPLAMGFALSLSRCGGGPPIMYAYADESEPALVLVEDGIEEPEPELDTEQVEGEPEPELDTEQVEGEPEPELDTEQVEGEPEPELDTDQVEGEPEPETTDHGKDIEQSATTEDVLEHIDAAAERLDAAVDLLMIGAGALGALLGYLAFGSVWRTLGGE